MENYRNFGDFRNDRYRIQFVSISLAESVQAHEIVSSTWINPRLLKLEELRGKVGMVEFWTFGCWNCRNIKLYVKEWHKKYAKQGWW